MAQRLPEHAEKFADFQHRKMLLDDKNATSISNHLLHYLGLNNERYVVTNILSNVVVILDRENLYRKITFHAKNGIFSEMHHYFEISERFYDDTTESFLKDYSDIKVDALQFIKSIPYAKSTYNKATFRFNIEDNEEKTIREDLLSFLKEFPETYDFTLDDYYKTKKLNTTYEWELSKDSIPFENTIDLYTSVVFREVFGINKLHVDDFKLISSCYDFPYSNSGILKLIDEKPAFFDLIEFDKNDRLTKDSIELFNINYKK